MERDDSTPQGTDSTGKPEPAAGEPGVEQGPPVRTEALSLAPAAPGADKGETLDATVPPVPELPVSSDGHAAGTSPRRSDWIAAFALAIICMAICTAIAWDVFKFSQFENDDTNYLFQAKLFARGLLSATPPPDYESGFLPTNFYSLMYEGKWYSMYPYGNSLALALGVLLGNAWIVPIVMSGAVLLIMFRYCFALFGRACALIAAVLFAFSPATVFLGGTIFSENTSRFCLALFVWAVAKYATEPELSPGWKRFLAVLCGVTVGYTFNTRPLAAVCFGGVFGLGYTLLALRRRAWQPLTRFVALGAVSFGVFGASTLAWNYHFNGDPFVHTHAAKLGFDDEFTGEMAVHRLLVRIVPTVAYTAFGLGDGNIEKLFDFLPYTQPVTMGLAVKSPGDNDWAAVKLWGVGVGTAWMQFQSRARDSGNGLTIRHPAFQPIGGQLRATIRIKREGERIFGYFRERPDQQWQELGPTTLPLHFPLEVGIFAGVPDDGRFTATFRDFKVLSDEGGDLQSSALTDQAELTNVWELRKSSGCPYSISPETGLKLEPYPESNLWNVDTTCGAWQTVRSGDFDVQVEVSADWRDAMRPVRVATSTAHGARAALTYLLTLVPYLLAAIGVLVPGSRYFKLLFLVGFAVVLGAHCFHRFDFIPNLYVPHSVRFYNEASVLLLIPLVAAGLAGIFALTARLAGRIPAVTLLCLLGAGWGWNLRETYLLTLTKYREYQRSFQGPPGVITTLQALVAEQAVRHAVVFIPRSFGSIKPLGDYPFRNLADANIVYYWFDAQKGWEGAYAKYFTGRTPFLYENEALVPLQPQAGATAR